MSKEKLIVALDTGDLKKARCIVNELSGIVKIFKVGSQLFARYGPKAVDMVNKRNCKVFLDLKFHDIPNTVKSAVESAKELGVFMLTLHTLGGKEMLKAASGVPKRPKLVGVTVLTSLNNEDLSYLGINRGVEDEVLELARLAKESELDGAVCSPKEIALIRKKMGKDFIIVAPGIRLIGEKTSDQKRVLTPKEAIKLGADYIVVGRPIFEAKEPIKAAEEIVKEISDE
ncbi:MAG: orotidine-5'-phosphate decarboxylase [Candidatus Omnitrophica bacterium]|nr:orotidine-5'-phosphate decarboxylase [Candidatus Omnitrophota bacterium]